MNILFPTVPLQKLADKVLAGGRLSLEEGLCLMEKTDLHAMGYLAEALNRKKNGNQASFILNRYINYSNYCIVSCQFCAFAKKKRDGDGYELSLEQILVKGREAVRDGVTELHIVGGLHPSLPYSYYVDMIAGLRSLNAQLCLKCFTAVEILHIARISRKPFPEVLQELKQAGLNALTGGGAEIFNPEIRQVIAKGKESAEEYLDVHRTWHKLGGKSTCTMLFGHVESLRDRVEHLSRLRELQDETHGFVGFIPLAYQPENNRLPVTQPPTAVDCLRTLALSRIMLDNIDHITAYWVGLGMKLAQLALKFGADDIHGTITEEQIFHAAGAGSPMSQTSATMIHAIRQAGLIPIQRDTYYQPVKRFDS